MIPVIPHLASECLKKLNSNNFEDNKWPNVEKKYLLKETNDIVKGGSVIAIVGNSGGNLTNGLYYELRKNSKPFNPLKWTTLK